MLVDKAKVKYIRRSKNPKTAMSYLEKPSVARIAFTERPDYGFWGRMAEWATEDANALFARLDPDLISWRLFEVFKEDVGGETPELYEKLQRYMKAEWGERPDLKMPPPKFIDWANSMKLEVHQELCDIVREMARTRTHREATELNQASIPNPVNLSANWTLRKPERDQGYNMPLYDFLKAALDSGKPRPNAVDVLKAWKDNAPQGYGIHVSDNLREMTYHSGGNPPVKTISASAVTRRIDYYTNLTKAK